MNSNIKFKMFKLNNFKNLIYIIIINLFFLNLQTSSAQMFWNHAASFSGSTSSYIKCRHSTSLNVTGSFTLEAWINPSTLSGFSKGIISKGGAFGTSLVYGMRLEPTGRIIVATNGAARLRSKVSSIIPVNQWTHVASTYNFSTAVFNIYINGVLDTTATIASVTPVANTDTLYFGISGSSTPFAGMMDEIRLWSRPLSSLEIRNNMRTSIGAFGGVYEGLNLCLTFQTQFSNVPQFNMNDWSAFFNTCINNGVNDVDLSDVPSKTICINQAAIFDGADDYAAGADNIYVSPSASGTFQAWIFPRSNSDAVIIHKGTPNGSATNYSLNIINKKFAAKINGIVYDSGDTLELNQWTHVAFTYNYTGISKSWRFYVNGKNIGGSFAPGGARIADGTDSLYIGGTIGLADFNGLIDEVRISRYVKSLLDINDSLYIPMNFNVASLLTSASYNFDGYSRSNTPLGPNLFFRNQALMMAILNPLSPLDRAYSLNFQKAFYLKQSGKRIPETGGTGIIYDTLNILLDENISDINVYLALDHQNSGVIEADLIGPDGSVVRMLNNNELLSNNESVVTAFDDDAPTTMSNFTYTSFSPKIKPVNNLNSVFSGKNTKGLWKLKINDIENSDTGRLYVWGIQFNNKASLQKILSCKTLIQGFYSSSANTMIRDTVTCYARSLGFPYTIIDSAKAYLQNDGSGTFTFAGSGLVPTFGYYLQMKHRNSIETWSSNSAVFPALTSQTEYDFTTDSSNAFGNNQIQVDTSPVRFAIYGGDVNQDGVIDASDAGVVDNDATNFIKGYVNTDVTGDNVVDASDAALCDNNAANFVGKIIP